MSQHIAMTVSSVVDDAVSREFSGGHVYSGSDITGTKRYPKGRNGDGSTSRYGDSKDEN